MVCTALHQFAQALVVLVVRVDHGLHTSAMVDHKRDVHSQGSQGREVPQGVVLLGHLLEGQAQSLGFVQDNQDGPNQENLDTWGREVEDQAVPRRVLDSRREASVQGALQGLLAVLLYSQAVPVDLRWWAAWHRSFQVLRCTCCLVVASVPHLARRCSRSSHVGWEFAALARLAARCPVWCRGLPASWRAR